MVRGGTNIATTRKIERNILRHKVGNRDLSKFFRTPIKPKRESALKRGIKNLFKTLTGRW